LKDFSKVLLRLEGKNSDNIEIGQSINFVMDITGGSDVKEKLKNGAYNAIYKENKEPEGVAAATGIGESGSFADSKRVNDNLEVFLRLEEKFDREEDLKLLPNVLRRENYNNSSEAWHDGFIVLEESRNSKDIVSRSGTDRQGEREQFGVMSPETEAIEKSIERTISPEDIDGRISEVLLSNSRNVFSRVVRDAMANGENEYWLGVSYSGFGYSNSHDTNIVAVAVGYRPILESKYSLSIFMNLDMLDSSLKEKNNDGIAGKLSTDTVGVGIHGRAKVMDNLDLSAIIYYGFNANVAKMNRPSKEEHRYNSQDIGLAVESGYGFNIGKIYTLRPSIQLSYLNSNIASHDNLAGRRLGSLAVRYGLDNIIAISNTLGATLFLGFNQILITDGNSKDLYKKSKYNSLVVSLGLENKFSDKHTVVFDLGCTAANKAFGLGAGLSYRF
jgi:hypothetical protein